MKLFRTSITFAMLLNLSGCGNSGSGSGGLNGPNEIPLTDTKNITFAPPVDVACLSPNEGVEGLRLSGKDVYNKGYQDLLICRYPFATMNWEKVTSAAYLTTYQASDAGLFVERNGYVYFLPKVPFGAKEPVPELVGASRNPLDAEATFNLATTQSGLAALTIGNSTSFYKREPRPNSTSFQWKVSQTASPRYKDKLRMSGAGLYSLDDSGNTIGWIPVGGNGSQDLKCPGFCDEIAASEDGLYVLSNKNVSKPEIYFFDSAANRSTVFEPTAGQWKNVYGIFASVHGVYVHYLRSDKKCVLSFITRDGREVVVVESADYMQAVIANDGGALVLQKDVTQPSPIWRYYEMRVKLN